MSRELKAFLSQVKIEDLYFFGDQYFQNGVFLFSAPNKGKDFVSEKYFSKVSILPSFEISITGLKTVRMLQPPVPLLLLLVDKHTIFHTDK